MRNLFFALLFIANTTEAQQKVVDKFTFKTPMPKCEECKNYIELQLTKVEGVGSVNVNYRNGTTTVSWYTDRIDKESIKIYISSYGFTIDDMEADEYGYKRLPACCKFPNGPAKPIIVTPTPASAPAPIPAATPKPASAPAPIAKKTDTTKKVTPIKKIIKPAKKVKN
jgi:periplasmic mercuric ion binding protein